MNIATIKEAPGGLTVQRNGEVFTLSEGDSLQWGDELINETGRMATVFIPAQSDQQTSTELTLDPGSKAILQEKDTPLNDGSSRTEVVALTDGVELYDVDVSSEVMGLVGPVGGAGLGALAGAGLLAAGLLAGAAANDDDNSTTFSNQDDGSGGTTDGGGNQDFVDFNGDGIPDDENAEALAMGNQDQDGDGIADQFDTDDDGDGVFDSDVSDDGTTLRDGTADDFDGDGVPDDQDTDDDNDGIPDRFEQDPVAAPAQSAGVTGAVSALSDTLEETPLEGLAIITDGVAAQTGALGGTLEQNQDMDPSGTLLPLLSSTVGVADPDYNPDDSSGLVGLVDASSEGINSGLEAGALAPLAPLTEAVLGSSGDAETAGEGGDVAGLSGAVTELGEILVATDTELAQLTMVTEPLAEGLAAGGSMSGEFSGEDPSGVSSLLANTLGTSDPDYNTSDSSGLVGVLDSTSEGANTGIESTALAPASDMVSDPVLGSSGDAGSDSSTMSEGEATDESTEPSGEPLDMLATAVPIASLPLSPEDLTETLGSMATF